MVLKLRCYYCYGILKLRCYCCYGFLKLHCYCCYRVLKLRCYYCYGILKLCCYCCYRVLKPPGGGSSDIFGTSEAVQQSPRRAHTNHHLQSSVLGTNGMTETPTTRRNKPGNDSHSRLFGPVESRPQSTPVNRMKSNIPFGVIEGGSDVQQSGNSPAAKSGAVLNGQQEALSTPAGEMCSTVCTQTLKVGLLIRTKFMVCCGRTQQAFLWPLKHFNFVSFYKENFCL
jgi:hypothetical protein